jgi:hypothetical protein
MIAALFVDVKRGPYAKMEGVDAWGVERDARLYDGPHAVVAHPPCERWGKLWKFNGSMTGQLGDDGGCFAAAVAAVRRCGGVIEHPLGSNAWARFNLPPWGAPGVWRGAAACGWAAVVYQGHYGFPAPKPTLLWAYGVGRLPDLARGVSHASRRTANLPSGRRHVTPVSFAQMLVELAQGVAR